MTKNFSIFVYQELFEVPLHVCAIEIRFVSKPFVERVLSFIGYRGLCHHWEFNIELFDELDNFFGWVRFLRSELIAWIC